jgi:hypothetical protein
MSVELKVSENTFVNQGGQELLAVPDKKVQHFTVETLDTLSSLGHTLKSIRTRLLDSGEFEIVNRRLVKKQKSITSVV